MIKAELKFLIALQDATRRNAISWLRAEDDDRDIYQASVGGNTIEVEFVFVLVASGETSKRLVAQVSGLGTYFHASVGTEVYDAISEMLSLQVFGWAEGRADGLKALAKATTKVEGLV